MFQTELYPIKIKQIIDLICEERLTDMPNVEHTDPLRDIVLAPCQPAGSVYYSNNQITVPSSSEFMMLCYCLPMIVEDGDEGHIPDHLVMLTVCKALSILAESSEDVALCARYEAVYIQLVNAYNKNIIETLPNSLTRGFKLNAYSI